MEPAVRFNAQINNADVVNLVRFINSNEAAILANNYSVPDNWNGNFLGGKSHTEFPPTDGVNMATNDPHHWDGGAERTRFGWFAKQRSDDGGGSGGQACGRSGGYPGIQ